MLSWLPSKEIPHGSPNTFEILFKSHSKSQGKYFLICNYMFIAGCKLQCWSIWGGERTRWSHYWKYQLYNRNGSCILQKCQGLRDLLWLNIWVILIFWVLEFPASHYCRMSIVYFIICSVCRVVDNISLSYTRATMTTHLQNAHVRVSEDTVGINNQIWSQYIVGNIFRTDRNFSMWPKLCKGIFYQNHGLVKYRDEINRSIQ